MANNTKQLDEQAINIKDQSLNASVRSSEPSEPEGSAAPAPVGPAQTANIVRELYQSSRIKRLWYLYNLYITVIPFAGFLLAVVMVCRDGIGHVELVTLVLMYTLCQMGIEVGYHRLFTHRSFQAHPAVAGFLAICGSMSGQGRVIYWTALHRHHHAFSDKEGDIHSPQLAGTGLNARISGLWHGHVGWLFNHTVPNANFYCRDLVSDPVLRTINRFEFVWLALGLLIPTLIGASMTGTTLGAFQGFLWGGPVRMFLCNNFTYSVNSLCHVFGQRPFYTRDFSTNNFWLAVPTFGQAWHNNHHAFPHSAIMGLEWWQIDPGTWVVRLLQMLGLASDVHEPTPEMIQAKQRARQELQIQ